VGRLTARESSAIQLFFDTNLVLLSVIGARKKTKEKTKEFVKFPPGGSGAKNASERKKQGSLN
jgi:hypothetical protein